MPLVPHSDWPAFDRLSAEGEQVAVADSRLVNIRVGLLNLMPDAALEATDRQFLRLVSAYSKRANLYVVPFTVAADHRGDAARAHVAEHYADFGELRDQGLDALIITGANPAHLELVDEPFWGELTQVFDWADTQVETTLCSCLATHALLEHRGLAKRSKLARKRWGVYEHAVVEFDHPLLAGITDPVEAPHSHWFDMTAGELRNMGLSVLVVSEEAGVHMATSGDGFRYVFFQGHPEYDDVSLGKEYKREVSRYLANDRQYPEYPDHYFDESAKEVLETHRALVENAHNTNASPPEFPEEMVFRRWRPTWSTQGQTIYSNWLAELVRRIGS